MSAALTDARLPKPDLLCGNQWPPALHAQVAFGHAEQEFHLHERLRPGFSRSGEVGGLETLIPLQHIEKNIGIFGAAISGC